MAAVLGGLTLLYGLSRMNWSGKPSFQAGPAAPVKIRVEGPSSKVSLERKGDAWRVTDPLDWPADQAVADRLVAGLAMLESEGEVTRRAESFAQYDLDEGKAVRIKAWADPGKDPYEIVLGKSGPSPDRVYARLGKGAAVHLVGGLSRSAADLPVSRWRDRRIWDGREIVRVRATRGKGSFVLEKSSAAWTADGQPADEEKVQAFLSAVRLMEADDFADPGMAKEPKAYGLEKPSLVLEVSAPGGPVVTISVGKAEADPRAVRKGGVETLFLVPAYRFSALDKAVKDGAVAFSKASK
jgi:hypothetical protein